MKSLEKMTIKERAVAIHRLLPEEVEPFLKFTQSIAQQIKDGKIKVQIVHLTKRLKGRSWKEAAVQYLEMLKTSGGKMAKNAACFADTAFSEDGIPLTLYCLEEYALPGKCENHDFPLCASLFFL